MFCCVRYWNTVTYSIHLHPVSPYWILSLLQFSHLLNIESIIVHHRALYRSPVYFPECAPRMNKLSGCFPMQYSKGGFEVTTDLLVLWYIRLSSLIHKTIKFFNHSWRSLFSMFYMSQRNHHFMCNVVGLLFSWNTYSSYLTLFWQVFLFFPICFLLSQL